MRKLRFRLMLKLRFSTPNGLARGVSRPQAGEGAYGVRKRSFRLMLKLRFSTPKGLARGASRLQAGEGAEAELPPDAEAALQHSKQVSVRLTPLPQRGRGARKRGTYCAPLTPAATLASVLVSVLGVS